MIKALKAWIRRDVRRYCTAITCRRVGIHLVEFALTVRFCRGLGVVEAIKAGTLRNHRNGRAVISCFEVRRMMIDTPGQVWVPISSDFCHRIVIHTSFTPAHYEAGLWTIFDQECGDYRATCEGEDDGNREIRGA